MARQDVQVIVIKKKAKHGHHAHHGGAWKVAYADFVTAMMAFFLLLWLLNVTTDDQRQGIADYFDPANIARATSGSSGVLGGRAVSEPGQLSSPTSRFSLEVSLPGRPEPVDDRDNLDDGDVDPPSDAFERIRRRALADGVDPEDLSEDEIERLLAEREQAMFEQATAELRQAIQQVPDIQQLAENLIIDQTPEGLRIQIVDQEGLSMFPMGSARMFERTEQLMGLVAQVIGKLPQPIAISGHTDATPFVNSPSYDNWELSSDRANASRRALLQAGFPAERISRVVGKADTEHLFPDEPRNPRNRRISIVLLREADMETGETVSSARPAAPSPVDAASLN